MSDWKVTNKYWDMIGDACIALVSFGVSIIEGKTYIYTVENQRTGEKKEVAAKNEYNLGDKIAEGDFIEKD